MIKSTLQQNVIIQEITPNTIGVVVINEQFYHTISKPEVTHELENILHNQLNYAGHLKRTHMTKEERLLRHI